MTGTCNMACWHAQEDVCHCMCRGVNHGIMRNGGGQPGRYCQRKGVQYQLHGIHARWSDANTEAWDLKKAHSAVHGHGRWGAPEPAFNQMATGHMLKWPEVQAFLAGQVGERHPEANLVWVRMEAAPQGE